MRNLKFRHVWLVGLVAAAIPMTLVTTTPTRLSSNDPHLPKSARVTPRSTLELRFSVGLLGGTVDMVVEPAGPRMTRTGGTEHFASVPCELSAAFATALADSAPTDPYLCLTVTEAEGTRMATVAIAGISDAPRPTRLEGAERLKFWNPLDESIVSPHHVPAIITWDLVGADAVLDLRAMDVPVNHGASWRLCKICTVPSPGVTVIQYFVKRTI